MGLLRRSFKGVVAALKNICKGEMAMDTDRGGKTQSKSIVKETFQMAWPAVLESFFVALAGMIDSLMVSSIGAYAVAAVGVATPPKII